MKFENDLHRAPKVSPRGTDCSGARTLSILQIFDTRVAWETSFASKKKSQKVLKAAKKVDGAWWLDGLND